MVRDTFKKPRRGLHSKSKPQTLRKSISRLVDDRNSLISNRARLESLSMEFLVKAQRALKTGDEALAKEAMLLKHKQAEATQDILLHVDTEKQPLARLNNTLIDYQYIQKPSKQPLITMPASIPRTAAMKFSYLPSGAGHAAVIDGWQNAFSKEVKNYESFAVYAETKLQEAIHHAYQNQGGDHSKVDPGIPAICVDLMLKMGDSAFGFRFAPLIKLLSTQLIRCIYNINGDPSSTISQDELDKNKWLRRWKNYVFGNGGGDDEGDNNNAAASNPEERTWQKRFRVQEKQKQRMQDQINDLKEQLHHNQYELGMAYEVINELEPHLSTEYIGQQAATHRRTSAMRDIRAEDKAREQRGIESAHRVYRGSKFVLDLTHWKGQVQEKMKKHGTIHKAELAVFARNKNLHHTTSCQTDISGDLHESKKQRKTRAFVNKNEKTKSQLPLSINDIVDTTATKAPKTSLTQAINIISLMIGSLCKRYLSVSPRKLPDPAIPEFLRDLLIKKYGVRSLALKHIVGLCDLSTTKEESDPLLKIFNELVGIKTKGTRLLKQDRGVIKFDIFLLIEFLIPLCPAHNYSSISECLAGENERTWERASICSSIHTNFCNIRAKAPDAYKEMLAKITALPVTTLKGKEKSPRIPLDDAILIVMEYVEVERFSKSEKPSKEVKKAALEQIRTSLIKFVFKHHARRRKEMQKSMHFFNEWDEKLHKHSEDEEAAEGGSLTFSEFSEMVRARCKKAAPSEEMLLQMFNEWHALIKLEKKALGYTEVKVGDEMALMNLDNVVENFNVLVQSAEKEISEADELLDRKATINRSDLRKSHAIGALTYGPTSSTLIIPAASLPLRARLQDKNRLLYQKIQRKFMEAGFTNLDVSHAKELESTMKGYKFGESAFARLMWSYRIE